MTKNPINIHPKFKLNGFSYTKSGLKELAYDWLKEGKAYERTIGDFLLNWLDDSAFLSVNTSGSTGKPKTIVLQKQHMINSAVATGAYFNLKEGDTALLCLSVAFIAGKMMLVRAMTLGLQLQCREPISTPLVGDENGYDFCAMVPLQLENALHNIEQIKTLIVGGAPMSKRLIHKVQSKTTKIYETYGMTETITHVAVKRINHSDPKANELTATTSVHANRFEALPNVTFTIDERQCLVIDAPKVAKEEIITNDLVSLISASEFEWLGRFDTIINSGGVKLVPEQIEAKLEMVINSRFFVAGLPHEKFGQQLVLLIEGTIEENELLQKLQNEGNLERFEIPKKVYCLPQFLETDSGKVHREKNLRLISSKI